MAGLTRNPNGHKVLKFTYENEGEWQGPFCFIQGADTQFGLKDCYTSNYTIPDDKQTWDYELELTRQAIKAANNLSPRPRFFVVCGDMIDAHPGMKNYSAQLKDFKTVFRELDPEIPLLCVCGNHDVGNTPTAQAISTYRKNYGDDYYSFWVGGVFFIVINSQYYRDGSLVLDLKTEHDSWFEEQLKIAKSAKHAVVFQHIPWFLKSSDEPDNYFNIEKQVRNDALGKIKAAGVKYVFAGHYHQNAGGFDNDLEMVVTGAIGYPIDTSDKSGMRVVIVKCDKITHSYEEFETFPSKVTL